MKSLSKLRPSKARRSKPAETSAHPGAISEAAPRRPRIYRNSYTRADRRFFTNGWVVKLQHRGLRRTFSLRAKNKNAAATEAKAIGDTLLAEGWAAVERLYPNPRQGDPPSKSELPYWRERLLVRRHRFPGSGGTENDLAARIDHAGAGYWFPLGTADLDEAAAKALRIYETAVKHGWEECCRRFSRELIIGFEWCSSPLLWTYATIHTLVGKEVSAPLPVAGVSAFRRVLIVETNAGIRRALEWSINQQPGFSGLGCESPDLFPSMLETRRPHLVLLNRNLAERMKFNLPGQVAAIRGDVAALTYSTAVDGDQLFVSTPGGAEGYLIKRVRPDRLLDPILDAAGRADLPVAEILPRVKSYFKALLQPRAGNANAALSRLTRRENEVLTLLSKGCVDKEIAQVLGISAWTVHGHIKRIFERLQVRTRTEAVVRYLEK